LPPERKVNDGTEDECVNVVGVSIAGAEEVDRHLDLSPALTELEIRQTDHPRLRLAGAERCGRRSPENCKRTVTPARNPTARLNLKVLGVGIVEGLKVPFRWFFEGKPQAIRTHIGESQAETRIAATPWILQLNAAHQVSVPNRYRQR